MTKEDENCLGYVDRMTGGEGGFKTLTKRSFFGTFEETGEEDAEGVGFFHQGDGFPYHVAYKDSKGRFSHRSGPGGPVEDDLTYDQVSEGYSKNEGFLSKMFRRKKG